MLTEGLGALAAMLLRTKQWLALASEPARHACHNGTDSLMPVGSFDTFPVQPPFPARPASTEF